MCSTIVLDFSTKVDKKGIYGLCRKQIMLHAMGDLVPSVEGLTFSEQKAVLQ